MRMPWEWRPTWMGGALQVHITRACDLACFGCTQGSNLAGKPVVMSLEHFERAVQTLVDYPGVVGIFGGNPCVHPYFEEICEILSKYIEFEHRGLWSNNLMGYGAICRKTFNPAYSNLNVHTSREAFEEIRRDWPEAFPKGLADSRHSPPFVAIKDMEDISEEDMWRMIQTCDINKYWSAMVCVFRNQLRGYFCELAGAQSMLHENEKDYPDTGVEITHDWWKPNVNYFSSQISKHCPDCGIPLRGFGSLAIGGKVEQVSKTHVDIYKMKRPGRTIEIVTSTKQLGGKVPRTTDYCENGLLRMAV